MNTIQTNSSMLKSIGYDEQTEVLVITFKRDGRTFKYFDVPTYVYNDLVNAESKGNFFLENIKDVYEYE